ncbi:hypothetical protein SDC9_84403 [bioreactor metagenome]|uniref:Uncharacterized protein n=1 Tax=bioreactor metagenome TaxID=1076179 RepID=A0A644ZJ37_9ZZZZ
MIQGPEYSYAVDAEALPGGKGFPVVNPPDGGDGQAPSGEGEPEGSFSREEEGAQEDNGKKKSDEDHASAPRGWESVGAALVGDVENGFLSGVVDVEL